MESTHLHHLQHQPQPVHTSSLPTPSCYVVPSTHSSSNAGNFNKIVREAASRSRDSTLSSYMVQNSGYNHHWGSDAESWWSIKEEMCDTSSKFTEMLDNSVSSREQQYQGLQEPKDFLNGVRENLLLNSLSSSDLYSTSANGLETPNRGNFSRIHPTINISDLNHSSPEISKTSSNMDLNSLSPLDSVLSLMQIPFDRSSAYSSSIPSHFTNARVETKRPGTSMGSEPSQSLTTSKKLRPESRSSCPQLKVRKEKLGDRIAALQQLVAPFGKTDTASVLMEAIGYIKFLQNQVETLSVPYRRSSRNQNNRGRQGGPDREDAGNSTTRDLRSRGLCLVPLSSTSFITAGDHASTGVECATTRALMDLLN